jgi:hypothetical protein
MPFHASALSRNSFICIQHTRPPSSCIQWYPSLHSGVLSTPLPHATSATRLGEDVVAVNPLTGQPGLALPGHTCVHPWRVYATLV